MTVDSKKIIFSMVNVGKKYAQKTILKDISISYFYGAKIGILGVNGTGKSTLLKIMAGIEKQFSGEVHLTDGYTVGYLAQEPELNANKTVKETVSEGVSHITKLLKEFDEINNSFAEITDDQQMTELLDKQAKVQETLESLDAWSLDDKLNYAMQALNCPPAEQTIETLSGGERRRVALCRLLIQQPHILLLDEPTNHLDAKSTLWLEKHLQEYKGTVVAITHDRYFLENAAQWILEIHNGEAFPFKGNYTKWLEYKDARAHNLQKQDERRNKAIKRELEWVRLTPQARRSKNKSRIQAYEKLLNQEQEQVAKDLKIYIPPGPRLGDIVVEAKNISKSFSQKKLYQDLSFFLPPGGIIGIIGENGVGKTTLFKMIADLEKPDSGEFIIGKTAKIGYMEQMREHLNPNKTVYETIAEGQDVLNIGKREIKSRSYLAQFNFTGHDQEKLICNLSGGEINRIQLALLIRKSANVLLLDEPSNDLDVNTIRALEEALLNFAGCAVIISHDRWFLDRIATHILAFEGDGKIRWFEGSYSEYEQNFLSSSKDNKSNSKKANLFR